jgi:hypothetical protein
MSRIKQSLLLHSKKIAIAALVVLVGLVLFIRYDTPAAAEFTDNYLRPILGPYIVIGLEKIYYNLSDKIVKATYNSDSHSDFSFLDQGNPLNLTGNKLDLTPIKLNYFPSQKDEGVWKNRPLNIFPNQEVMAYTFVRPDKDRPYAYVTLVKIDTGEVHLSTVAGTKQPGGPVGKPGPGKIPQNIISSGNLIAAFDGGFQYRDGQYGMIVGSTIYLPLKMDLGTLVGYKNGNIKIINYTGQLLENNVEFIRQNCPILIDNGSITISDPKNRKLWGRTMTTDIYTWRSGIGIDKNGNIVYAVGNNLVPETLGLALKSAGAVNAIQLDINPFWVRFNIFNSLGGGKYSTSTLAKNLSNGSKEYLNGYTKDFFYLYKNS